MAKQQEEELGATGNSLHTETTVEHMAARWFSLCCLELRGAASFARDGQVCDTLNAHGLVSFDSGEQPELYGKLHDAGHLSYAHSQPPADHPNVD
jgi:hypothetical protein|eukprot:COSAG02_NODE_3479_length_6673_cov_3.496197_3_plen_95_part_00